MASVDVIGIEKKMNNAVEIRIEARTSVGRATLPFLFQDQGSLTLNEKHAFQEALTLVEEIAVELRLRLGL
jgi:hypothetical protein